MAEKADPKDYAQNPQSARSTSPVATFSHQTPQTAPAGRRGARQLSTPFASSSAQTASSPFSGGAASRRKRIRTFGFDGNPDDDDETNKKGSHNLRKRAKIDYSAHDFEDELPEIALPAPRTATRRRRAESEVVGDGFTPPSTQRRRANSREFSHTDDTPAGRRKTPAKRLADPQPYFPPSDDVVKDTIEVVGDSSDLHTSDEVSDHDSKVESPAAERKFKRQSATPDGAHARPTSSFERYDRFGNGSQPDHGAQANSLDNGQGSLEIAHPQPIHINHVSIITAPQLSQDSDTQAERHSEFKIERLSSRAAHFTSSPRASSAEQSAAGHGVPAVVPLSMRVQSNTQMAAAPAAPSTSSSSLDRSGRGDDGSAVQLTVNGRAHVQTRSESDIAGEAGSTERQLAPNASSRHEPSNTPYGDAVENNSQAGPVGLKTHTTIWQNHHCTNGATQPAQEHLGKSIDSNIHGPSNMDIGEDSAEIQVKTYAWSHLTPYVEGEVVLHPEPTMQVATAGGEGDVDEDGDAPDGDGEGNDDEQEAADKNDAAANDDADQYEDEADRDDGDKSASQTVQPEEDNSLQADGLADVDSGAATPLPQTPRVGSPVSASAQQTGANTPSAGEDKSKAAVASAGIQRMRKQFRFPKLSDPAHYREYLKDHSNMSTEELWAFLSHVNTTLLVWQEEWQKCGRQVDDAENAKRREIQDAEYEKKTANLSQFAKVDSYVEKDFDTRGYRAPIKEKEQGTFHQRWQDRVEAMAYGYEYDPHPSKIGQQDPIAQRDGIMAGRQLRSQPQQTAKAAEDRLSIRTRRTSTTRMRMKTRRQRTSQGPKNGDQRGRGPQLRIQKPTRQPQTWLRCLPSENAGGNQRLSSQNLSLTRQILKIRNPRNESRPTTSSSNATISDDGSTYSFRQNKRQRTSRGEAQDDEEIVEAVQPPKKKTRINFKASTRPQAAHKATRSEAILGDMAAASPAASATLGEPSHLITFKHMGDDKWTVNRGSRPSRDSSTAAPSAHVARLSAAPSAPHSAASSAAPSQAGDDQDYRLMTKSQKMSASMKKRWLNGSMQNAVNKRKATLAAKKAANAQAAMVAAAPAPPQSNGHNPFTNGTQFQQ
ncbi:hypothetical protein HYQ44_000057 [Verticillium longisporum]|nr:hypothetical protein HYQ44_000057 [Verticillium longisporum]